MSRGRLVALGLLVALAAGGCFGDWVSARPRPRGGEAEGSSATKLDLGTPVSADACGDYVAAVAERCDAVLDGRLGRCHRELVRVMALWREDPEPLDHRPRSEAATTQRGAERGAGPTAETCAQHLRALSEVEPPRPTAGARLGPACREWAEAVRERCVAPLASIPPDLRRCGPDLLAFEGILGAATFGRPEDYEPQCRSAVERLARPAEPPAEEGPAAPSADARARAAEDGPAAPASDDPARPAKAR